MVVHRMSGDFQAPTQSRKSSPKVKESVLSQDELEKKHSLCMQNHTDSTQPPLKEDKSCSELACLAFLSFRGKTLSPQKKFRALSSTSYRSRCLDFHNTGTGSFSVLSFGHKRHTRKLRSPMKGANGGIAWMALPGLLVNADEASDGTVKVKGHRESVVWNGFAPLQKVLIVAVTAAAATAAKQKYSKEMRNLQCAIDIRDKDLETLRGKIAQLQEHLSFWKEQAQNLWMEAKDARVTEKLVSSENATPLLKVGLENTPRRDAVMLDQLETPQTANGLIKMPQPVPCLRKNMRAASFKKSIYRFGGIKSEERSDDDNHEIRTFLDRLSESPSFHGGQFNASTPQLPFTRLNTIDTPQLPSSNASSQQGNPGNLYFQKGFKNIAKDSLLSSVPCVALILQLKAMVRQIQNVGTPEVMAALASVKNKMQMLDSTTSGQTDLLLAHHIQAVTTDLKESIEQVFDKVTLLQKTIGSVWDIFGEDSQTDVISSQQSICLSKGQLSTSQEANDEKEHEQNDMDHTEILNMSCAGNQEEDQTKVNSALFQLIVNSTVDTLMTPLSGKGPCDSEGWSSEMVIEQLLGELENAAAKVASMEAQINSLKETDLRSERKKEGIITSLDEPRCHACKETDFNVRSLEAVEKRLATCREACRKKEKTIARLENENATLQELVSELRSIQVTPKVVTSNMLFNLDSPVKIDSPQRPRSPFLSWRHPDELSRESDSLERKSMSPLSSWRRLGELSQEGSSLERKLMNGSCDSDMYRSIDNNNHVQRTDGFEDASEHMGMYKSDTNNHVPCNQLICDKDASECMLQAADMYNSDGKDHAPHAEVYKVESECMLQASRASSCRNITLKRGHAKDFWTDRSVEEEVSCRSSGSIDEPLRKSGNTSTRSSSDNSSSGSVADAHIPRPPRSYSGHARKLKFANAAEMRIFKDGVQRMPSEAASGRRRDITSNKASNVLAGVEPNTPMKDRKSSNGSKERSLGHSLDSLNKAKENFSMRRRWM